MRSFSIPSILRLACLLQLAFWHLISSHPASITAKALQTRDDPLAGAIASAAACAVSLGLCSACGGEDPKNKGHCKSSSTCPCAPDKQLITKVVSSKTAIGTYQATSFSEFASISTTTTVTKTVTQNGKETTIPIAVAGAAAGAGIIGGIAWWLASSSGDAAAAEALPESVDTEEPEEPDEPKCDNNNKPWCVDCGDADAQGNCKTGDHAGCPCKQPNCPTGGDTPLCTEDTCNGKDNKCTKDPIRTCLCCPNRPFLCSADDCKGAKNICETGPFKGCQCFGEADASSLNLYWLTVPNQNVVNNWQSDLFKTQYSGQASNIPFGDFIGSGPAIEDVQCTDQLNELWSPTTIQGLAKQFCNGFDPNKDKQQTFKDDATGICSTQIDIAFKHGRPGDCSKSCEDTFNDLITRCEFNSHTWNRGATFKPPCGEFTITPSSPDTDGISNQVCYSDQSQLPKGALAQTWDPARAGPIIDVVCGKKLDGTIKGSCDLGGSKQGFIGKSDDPVVFAYAHYHGNADGCPGTGTQFDVDNNYINQDTFKGDCTKALNAAFQGCTASGNCGQTYGGQNRYKCIDYKIYMSSFGSPSDDAKACGAA